MLHVLAVYVQYVCVLMFLSEAKTNQCYQQAQPRYGEDKSLQQL